LAYHKLDLSFTGITASGLQALAELLNKHSVALASSSSSLSTSSTHHPRSCSSSEPFVSVSQLDLSDNDELADEGFIALARCPALFIRSLNVSRTNLTDDGLQEWCLPVVASSSSLSSSPSSLLRPLSLPPSPLATILNFEVVNNRLNKDVLQRMNSRCKQLQTRLRNIQRMAVFVSFCRALSSVCSDCSAEPCSCPSSSLSSSSCSSSTRSLSPYSLAVVPLLNSILSLTD
jgi:hypothetical protein